jgi:hypothetical protein
MSMVFLHVPLQQRRDLLPYRGFGSVTEHAECKPTGLSRTSVDRNQDFNVVAIRAATNNADDFEGQRMLAGGLPCETLDLGQTDLSVSNLASVRGL